MGAGGGDSEPKPKFWKLTNFSPGLTPGLSRVLILIDVKKEEVSPGLVQEWS